jgi:hypothetical protein
LKNIDKMLHAYAYVINRKCTQDKNEESEIIIRLIHEHNSIVLDAIRNHEENGGTETLSVYRVFDPTIGVSVTRDVTKYAKAATAEFNLGGEVKTYLDRGEQ